jgi:hypothetical protein
MPISASKTLKLSPEAPIPFSAAPHLRILHFATEKSENSERTAGVSLFFRPSSRRRLRISAKKRGAVRCYFAAETAKTAKGRWCPANG